MAVTTPDLLQSPNQLAFYEQWMEGPAPAGALSGVVSPSGSDRVLVLDTTPLSGNSQPIVTFGKGFYGPERDMGGRGDHWTNGRGNAYFFTRLEVEEIHLDYYSPFPDGTRLEMILSRLDDAAKQTFVTELHVEFWGKSHDISRLAIPLKLQPAALYRITLISPSFAPDPAAKPVECLGLAVVAAEVTGRPFTPVVKAPGVALAGAGQGRGETSDLRTAVRPLARLQQVKRITISEDITRPSPDGVLRPTPNLAWFSKLLQYPVSRAVGGFPMGQLEYEGLGAPDWRRMYSLSGYSVCEADWARLSGRTSLDAECLEMLDRAFSGSLVLGFELPDLLIRYFLYRGIPYVDTIVHPARFLDDIFLAFRTNVPQAFEALRPYALPEEQIYVQAGIHAATVARMRPLPAPENSCLLLGQTRVDKSLIDGNRVLSLDDFRDELRQLAGEHSRIYFKRHPYAQENPAIVEELQREGILETTAANTYALLCNDNISKVVSISSGALYEAKYFGKKAQYLARPSFQLAGEGSRFDPWACIGVYDAFYTPRFWADVLSAVCPVDNCPEVHIPPKTSRLRTSLQMYWGYNFLDHDILLNNLQGKQITQA